MFSLHFNRYTTLFKAQFFLALIFLGCGCGQVAQITGALSNSTPVDATLSLSTNRVVLNSPVASVVEISASASDPDNDTLTYTFSVSSGNLQAGSDVNQKIYEYPQAEGSYLVTVVISDGQHSVQLSSLVHVYADEPGNTSSGLGIYGLVSSVGFGNAYFAWTNPDNTQYVYVRRDTQTYPQSLSEGTLVAQRKTLTNVSTTGLADGAHYFSFFVLYGNTVQEPVQANITVPSSIDDFEDGDLAADGQTWTVYSGAEGNLAAEVVSRADGAGKALNLSGESSNYYLGGMALYTGKGLDPSRYFSVDIYNPSGTDVQLKVTLYDDDNRDAANVVNGFSHNTAADDIFETTISVPASVYGSGFVRLSLPLSAFTDANAGGDGIFNPTCNLSQDGSAGLIQLTLDVIGTEASQTVELQLDDLAFSVGDETEVVSGDESGVSSDEQVSGDEDEMGGEETPTDSDTVSETVFEAQSVSDLLAVAYGDSIGLRWTNPATVDVLYLYRDTSAISAYGSGTLIATLTNADESYTDTSLTEGTTYYYALYNQAQSDLSAAVSVYATPKKTVDTFSDGDYSSNPAWSAYGGLTMTMTGAGTSLELSGSTTNYFVGGAIVYAGINIVGQSYLAMDIQNLSNEDVQFSIKLCDDDDGGQTNFEAGYACDESVDDVWVASGNISQSAFASATTLYLPLNNTAFTDANPGQGNDSFDLERDFTSNNASAGLVQLTFELAKYNQSSAAISLVVDNIKLVSSGEAGDLGPYTDVFLADPTYEDFAVTGLQGLAFTDTATVQWAIPEAVEKVSVRASTSATPNTLSDGVAWLTDSTATEVNPSGLTDGATYYVTVFSQNSAGDVLAAASLVFTPRSDIADFDAGLAVNTSGQSFYSWNGGSSHTVGVNTPGYGGTGYALRSDGTPTGYYIGGLGTYMQMNLDSAATYYLTFKIRHVTASSGGATVEFTLHDDDEGDSSDYSGGYSFSDSEDDDWRNSLAVGAGSGFSDAGTWHTISLPIKSTAQDANKGFTDNNSAGDGSMNPYRGFNNLSSGGFLGFQVNISGDSPTGQRIIEFDDIQITSTDQTDLSAGESEALWGY